MTNKDLINHVAFVLDASGSMRLHSSALIRVADEQIAYLARRSQEMDQETRVTVYTFADKVHWRIFDKDVLRLPSMKGLYQAAGQTSLIDAVMQSQEDLRKTATMYGDHAFLTYVLTDGAENNSHKWTAAQLRDHLRTLQDNETVGLLVPDWQAKQRAEDYGFHRGNIAVWDATSEQGMEEAMQTMRTATDSYMHSRAAGVKSSTGIFTMDPSAVNSKTVSANLKELSGFRVERVKDPAVIQPFIESLGLPFISGRYFFPLIKRERIGGTKELLVRHKVSGKIFGGGAVRQMLGLPDTGDVSVSPQPNGEYDVFVQSTSLNRKLIPGHDLLIRV